jgi:hypothetical protein
MKYVPFILSMCLSACGGGADVDNLASTATEENSSESSKSCLAEMTDPSSWLTPMEVAEIVNHPAADLDPKIYAPASSSTYRWKSGRMYTLTVGNRELQTEVKNELSVVIRNLDKEIEKWLSKKRVKQTEMSYAQYFDQFHGNPTADGLMDEVNRKLDTKAANDQEFSAKAANVAKNAIALVKTEKFTETDIAGNRASFYVHTAPNLHELRLAVLHGNVLIQIIVDASDDDDEDLTMAMEAAKVVMSRCD